MMFAANRDEWHSPKRDDEQLDRSSATTQKLIDMTTVDDPTLPMRSYHNMNISRMD